jgi:hypothetical protein
MKRPEFHSVFDRGIAGQNSNREIPTYVFDPTALADRLEPQRDRFVEAFSSDFGAVLDPFGIADGDAAGTDCHRRRVAYFALSSPCSDWEPGSGHPVGDSRIVQPLSQP